MPEWKDETPVQSEVAVVQYAKLPVFDNVAPVFGFETPANIGDFPAHYHASLNALNGVAVSTTSAALAVGARRAQISVTFGDANATCDVLVYIVKNNVDTLLKTFKGVSRLAAVKYVGGQDLLDLDGYPVKVRVENISAGTITVDVQGY